MNFCDKSTDVIIIASSKLSYKSTTKTQLISLLPQIQLIPDFNPAKKNHLNKNPIIHESLLTSLNEIRTASFPTPPIKSNPLLSLSLRREISLKGGRITYRKNYVTAS